MAYDFLLTGLRSPGLPTLGDTLRTTSFTPNAVLDRDGSGPRGLVVAAASALEQTDVGTNI